MSYPWMTVRGASANPSSLKFAALMNKQNLIENEIFKPDRVDLPILSCHTDDLVLLQDPFSFQKLKPKTIRYTAPFEPDGVTLRLWIRFNHLATAMKDSSFSNVQQGFTNPIIVNGSPKLCAGPDDGIKGGTIVTRINHNPDVLDYYNCLNPDEQLIGVSEQTQGFTLYFEFMLEGDPVQDNGEDPTLWFHVDDSNGDYGTMLKVGVNRELKFFVRDSATTYNFISANNKITSGVFHTAIVKYNPTGNVLSMKIDDELQSDSASESPTFPSGHENGVFMGIGSNVNAGRFVGRFKDARWYRNLISNDDHDTNIWNNKRSICAANVVNFNGTTDYVDLAAQTAIWSKNMDKFVILNMVLSYRNIRC